MSFLIAMIIMCSCCARLGIVEIALDRIYDFLISDPWNLTVRDSPEREYDRIVAEFEKRIEHRDNAEMEFPLVEEAQRGESTKPEEETIPKAIT
jgi:hypothetical protein